MKKFVVTICLLASSLTSTVFAGPTSVELSSDAAKIVGKLLRKAEQKGNSSVKFEGGPQVTAYSVDNISCSYQNSDDSVSCSAESQLSESASKTIGTLLRQAEIRGNRHIIFQGGPNVTTYSVGNLFCYFQNEDDSVSCSVDQ